MGNNERIYTKARSGAMFHLSGSKELVADASRTLYTQRAEITETVE